jgi:hypothetical protein
LQRMADMVSQGGCYGAGGQMCVRQRLRRPLPQPFVENAFAYAAHQLALV